MTNHDELSYYLSQGLAVHVDGITVGNDNLEHVTLVLNEDDSYMKEFIKPGINAPGLNNSLVPDRYTLQLFPDRRFFAAVPVPEGWIRNHIRR